MNEWMNELVHEWISEGVKEYTFNEDREENYEQEKKSTFYWLSLSKIHTTAASLEEGRGLGGYR